MSPILSVVVPLENVQADLHGEVERLLECAADLTPSFELLLLHNNPTKQPSDAVYELCRSYPQVRLIRQINATAGLISRTNEWQQVRGVIVIVVEAGARVSPGRLRQLWSQRNDEQLVVARSEPMVEVNMPGWLQRLMQWGEQLREVSSETGLQLIRRNTPDSSQPTKQDLERIVLEYRLDSAHAQGTTARRGSFLQHLRDLAIG